MTSLDRIHLDAIRDTWEEWAWIDTYRADGVPRAYCDLCGSSLIPDNIWGSAHLHSADCILHDPTTLDLYKRLHEALWDVINMGEKELKEIARCAA